MVVSSIWADCGNSIYRSPYGIVRSDKSKIYCGYNSVEIDGPLRAFQYYEGLCTFSYQSNSLPHAYYFDGMHWNLCEGQDGSFVTWKLCMKSKERSFFTVDSVAVIDGIMTVGLLYSCEIEKLSSKLIARNFQWQIEDCFSHYYYGRRGDRHSAICQLDHDLNVLWQIDEPTLREYGKVDKDDPRAEKYEKRCAVRNIQVFGDTLYYMYNFSMIIALDAHSGAFKRRFSRFPADHHSKYMNPLNGVECRLMRDIDALHAGRYIEELHAYVIVRQEHLIEIDYETLTARARPIHVHHLWKNSMATTDPVVTMIGKDRIAVHAQMSKDVAILDYHTLEVLDFLRLDEEDPSGYLRGSLYHDGKLYVLSTAPSSAVKGCTLYEVEVDRETSS